MQNYKLANLDKVKESIHLRQLVLRDQQSALIWYKLTLQNYTKRKTIDKYLKDYIESSAPTYTTVWQVYNPQTQKDEPETKIFPRYSMSIQKEYFNKVTLYIHHHEYSPLDIIGAPRHITFTFYNSLPDAAPFTPAGLITLVDHEIKCNKITLDGLNKDAKDIDNIVTQYNKTLTDHENLLDSLHFYTRDIVKGNSDFSLRENICN